MKNTSLFFCVVCLLQVTLHADSLVLRKLLEDFKYTGNYDGITLYDSDVIKLDPFFVVESEFDDKKFRQLDASLRHRHKLSQFEKTQRVNMFGTSLFIDDQAYSSSENRIGSGSPEIPLVTSLRSIDKKIKGGIILSENATLYLRTGVRWKIPGLPDNIQVWLPYRQKSTFGIGLRIEEKQP